MARKHAVELIALIAQDRAGVLDDIPGLADGVHPEGDLGIGPASAELYVATIDDVELDGLSEDLVLALVVSRARAV